MGDDSGRFIPARAGNTLWLVLYRANASVHPRAGGEHIASISASAIFIGSSPRGRGTLVGSDAVRLEQRFIPARAGNTMGVVPRTQTRPVHPRAGGEHMRSNSEALRFGGSSPRGRGTHPDERRRRAVQRFIPARAGNTYSVSGLPTGVTVHPRAGGEHYRRHRANTSCSGSSPRGRGTPALGERLSVARRFIPARAGNTGRVILIPLY